MEKIQNFEDLAGHVLVHCAFDDDSAEFITADGQYLRLTGLDGPPNDCRVWLESFVGDPKDLIGRPILMAEAATSREGSTWTFYKLATSKGYADLRFCGESNGYYCEEAVLCHLGRVDAEPYLKNLSAAERLELDRSIEKTLPAPSGRRTPNL